ncbi:hypothetical protein TWF730_007454 [Orbilia blumenaviensis]|uniref:Peptidase S8/S53 domain-containing protein n=1 Tax=Orbilia blumenaviensis TaxID=1796055 RepID=A0AAV9VA62_9PEZI
MSRLTNKAAINAQNHEGQTPLHLAVKNGHIDAVRTLIMLNADIRMKDDHGQRPMHLAVKEQRVEIVKMLSELEIDILAKDNNGQTPLHLAAANGNSDIRENLIKHGANIEAKDNHGRTPLHIAAAHGQSTFIKAMKSEVQDIASMNDFHGQTPLQIAMEKNHWDTVNILLELAKKDKRDDGRLPLHLAAQIGCSEIGRELIDLELNEAVSSYLERANRRDNDLYSLYGGRAGLWRSQTKWEVVSRKDEERQYKEQQYKEQEYEEQEYEEQQYEIKEEEQRGEEPKEEEQGEIPNYILETQGRKIALNLTGRIRGRFPEYRWDGYQETVEGLLRRFYSDISSMSDENIASIYESIYLGVYYVKNKPYDGTFDKQIGDLLKTEASSGSKQASIGSLVVSAINGFSSNRSRHIEEGVGMVLFLMLKQDPGTIGSIIDVGDKMKQTPQHLAAANGHAQFLEMLSEYKANFDVQDQEYRTPLSRAIENGQIETVIKMIKNNNIFPDHENRKRDLLIKLVQKKKELKELPKPMFPIIINGNALNEETRPKLDASETNYILIQSQMRLSPSNIEILTTNNVEIQHYVSECTYLCLYQSTETNRKKDLSPIRRIYPIVYVDIYRQDFKITPGLKKAKGIPGCIVDVCVNFHDDAAEKGLRELVGIKELGLDLKGIVQSPGLRRINLKEETEASSEVEVVSETATLRKIEVIEEKARLRIESQHLDMIAEIDEVRFIEEVGKIKFYNDRSRVAIGIDTQPGVGPGPFLYDFQGQGQVIAIADTGVDHYHPAFQNRIRGIDEPLGPMGPGDSDGHGTHVCGSALGDAYARNGIRVRGTAPEATLVMQKLNLESIPLGIATQLFKPPYTYDNARVHSNSWGSDLRFPATGVYYTGRARDIDQFVYYHQDMVICWAAGNSGEEQVMIEAIAKNCITIGASEYRGGVRDTAEYSSGDIYGLLPNDQGYRRQKLDVIAPGTGILSARSSDCDLSQNAPDYGEDWCYLDGTSMATPFVAGCAAVLIQATIGMGYRPTAALTKALLINGTEIISSRIPDGGSGYGQINLRRSMYMARRRWGAGFEQGMVSLSQKIYSFEIPIEHPCDTIRVTLAWSDPPSYDLRNHLRLELWHGDHEQRSEARYNNVQMIIWQGFFDKDITVCVMPLQQLDFRYSRQPFAVVWLLQLAS